MRGWEGCPRFTYSGLDFHDILQDTEKVSELEAVMEKQKKKVEGETKTEVI